MDDHEVAARVDEAIETAQLAVDSMDLMKAMDQKVELAQVHATIALARAMQRLANVTAGRTEAVEPVHPHPLLTSN